MRRLAVGSLLLAALAVAAACGGAGAAGTGGTAGPPVAPPEAGDGEWRSLPPPPLGAREGAAAVWTGREVLVIGGSDAPPCRPGADCLVPDRPALRDGAALDPATGRWRRTADAPVPVEWAGAVVVGGTAYLDVAGSDGRPGAVDALLAYRIADDRWSRLDVAPGDDYRLLAAGDRLVAYRASDDTEHGADLVLDPATGAWGRLPDDPFARSSARTLAWTGSELVLFRQPAGDGSEPPIVDAAVLRDGRWRRLPASGMVGSWPWFAVSGRLVNPSLGTADGGEVDGWGSPYPLGGALDPAGGRWSPLPDTPFVQDESTFGVGVLDDGRLQVAEGDGGWVLDADAGRWIGIAPRPGDGDAYRTGQAVVAAGDRLVVVGGTVWDRPRGRLMADAWEWIPASRGDG